MSMERMTSLHKAKLGKRSCANITVDATVTKNATPLEAGWHVIEATTDCRVLQCNLAQWTTPPNSATVLAEGRKVLAGAEIHFHVEHDKSDGYLLVTRVSVDGTLEVHRSDTIYTG
jgi:hypothetical protein